MKNLELFIEYKKTGEENIRNDIFQRYTGLVHYICKKFGEENTEDMQQEGFIQLLKAIDKFDITKKVTFKTYAYHIILKGILNYRNSNMARGGDIPRRKMLLYKELQNKENEKEPLTNKEFVELARLSSFINPIQLDEKIQNNNEEDLYLEIEGLIEDNFDIFKYDIINLLNERQKKVVELILEDYSVIEISKILNVTNRTIQRDIEKIKSKIKKYLYE